MNNRSRLFGCAAVAFTAAVLLSSPARATSTDDFIKKAAIGGNFEIASSRLALQVSSNDDIKQVAQQMVDDHTQIDNQLKSVITASNTPMPQPEVTLDSAHQKMLDKLNKLSGPAFDKEYIKDQMKAHNEAVKLFAKYSKNGDNDSLKAFAKDTLPTLQEHQQAVDKLEATF